MKISMPSNKNQAVRWGFRILFFLFSWLYLYIAKEDYLFKIQDNNYFIFDPSFVDELSTKQAWIIAWISRFILQFCYYPILGAAIIAVLLSGVELIVSKLFEITERWFIIGFIPSIALLTAFCSVTYEFFDIFDTCFVVANILIFYYALFLFFLYKKSKETILSAIIISIVAIILTVWLGCPSAMVALFMIGCHALFNKKFAQGAIALLIGGLGSYLGAKFASYHILPSFIGYSLFYPWPSIYYTTLLVTTITTQIIAILTITSYSLYKGESISDKFTWPINCSVGVILIAIMVLFCRFPYTLKEELRLQHLAHQSEWKQMVKEMKNMDASSRVIAAYRVIALINTGELTQKVFNYHYSYSLSNFKKYNEEMVYYPELMLYASFPQISYRWCMEVFTDSQASMNILKIMALSAFANEEYNLAKRYLTLLQKSWFYKDWADDMAECLDHPEKYEKRHPEVTNIKKGRPFAETTGVFTKGATSVYDRYMALPNISAERRLLTRMYRRDLDNFEKEIKHYPLVKTELPRCMQEALMMKAVLTNNPNILKRYPVSQEVRDYVVRFTEYYKKHHEDPQLPLKMKEKFGYSYCHYFAFGIGAEYYNNKMKEKDEK